MRQIYNAAGDCDFDGCDNGATWQLWTAKKGHHQEGLPAWHPRCQVHASPHEIVVSFQKANDEAVKIET